MYQKLSTHPFQVALCIALASLVLRLVFILFIPEQNIATYEFVVIARNLLDGLGFEIGNHGTSYRTFGSPPFAFLSAFVYGTVGFSQRAMLVVQAGFSFISILACYGIACRLFSQQVGLGAALLVGFHPGLFYVDTHKVHPLSFDVALATLGVLLSLELWKQRSLGNSFITGLVHGLAFFERSTFVGLMPLALWGLWRANGRAAVVRLGAVYLAVFAAVLAPWALRNALLFHEPVLVSTTGGEVFWRGNNPVASGGAYAEGRPGVAVFEAAPESFKQQVLGKDELTQNHIFYRAGASYIREHPAEASALYLKKLGAFWWFSAHSGFLYPESYLRLYKAYYAVIVVLALIGLAGIFRESRSEPRLAQLGVSAFMLSVSLTQAMFYVEGRHRWGIESLLLIFAAAGAIQVCRRMSQGKVYVPKSSWS